MKVIGGTLFNDDGSVFEGTLDLAAIGGVTTAQVASALGAADAEDGQVLTADGAGAVAFETLPA
jgi:hypothetical protein